MQPLFRQSTGKKKQRKKYKTNNNKQLLGVGMCIVAADIKENVLNKQHSLEKHNVHI